MNHIHISGLVARDEHSRIRGLGRYAHALDAALSSDAGGSYEGELVYVNPFFHLIARPHIELAMLRSAHRIAVVHDVIPLSLPQYPWLGIKGRVWVRINRAIMGLYNSIVTDSHASRQSISRLLGVLEENIHVIYPYSPIQDIDPDGVPNSLPLGLQRRQYCVYVGDVNWHKNIVYMAQAAVQAHVTLLCVGGVFRDENPSHLWSEDLRALRTIAQKYPHIIQFTGYVDDPTLAALYKGACANVLVSHDEGFGYSYIEAAHFSTPSILSNIPVMQEVSGGLGAIFVNQHSVDDIAKAIRTLKEDSTHQRDLADKARLRSMRYSRESFKQDWLSLIAKE